MTRRYGLRDDQWEPIPHLLPGREGTVGRTACIQPPLCRSGLIQISGGNSLDRLTRKIWGLPHCPYPF